MADAESLGIDAASGRILRGEVGAAATVFSRIFIKVANAPRLADSQIHADSAWRRTPKARATFNTVAKLGLPVTLRAL